MLPSVVLLQLRVITVVTADVTVHTKPYLSTPTVTEGQKVRISTEGLTGPEQFTTHLRRVVNVIIISFFFFFLNVFVPS